jgi:hypothetical protein
LTTCAATFACSLASAGGGGTGLGFGFGDGDVDGDGDGEGDGDVEGAGLGTPEPSSLVMRVASTAATHAGVPVNPSAAHVAASTTPELASFSRR